MLIAYPGGKTDKSYTVPSSVTSIGVASFVACPNLTDVTIGSNVDTIGDSAFYNCENLKKISVPDSVTDIGEDVFADCYKLTIKCNNGSVIYKYAKDNDIQVSLNVDTPKRERTFFSDYEEVAEALVTSFNTQDVELYYDLQVDPYFEAYALSDKDTVLEELRWELSRFAGYETTYMITDEFYATKEDFDTSTALLTDNLGYPKNAVDDIMAITMDLYIKNYSEEMKDSLYLILIEIDGYWYISFPLTEYYKQMESE